MTNESILISEVIPATPQRIFSAWMDQRGTQRIHRR